MSSMKAVQFHLTDKALSLAKLPIPQPTSPQDVIVKVAFAGVCGTDIHIIDGAMPCKERNLTLGHEFSGVVTAVGAAVSHVAVGDRVAIDPNDGCRKCTFCTQGQYHFCPEGSLSSTIGIYRDGGWAEYCRIPVHQVHKLPEGVSLAAGVLCEPLSCIVHGWDKVGSTPHASKVLIMGAGIIGNLWACLFHLHGYRNVTISEPQEGRRRIAQKLGTGYEIVTPVELRGRYEKGDWGVNVVVDCTGHGPAMEEAFRWLLPGGKYCIFGVAPPTTQVKISPYEMFKKELTIVGVIINPYCYSKTLGLLEVMCKRYLQYETLGVKTFDLENYNEAIEELRKGSIAKAVFKISGKD